MKKIIILQLILISCLLISKQAMSSSTVDITYTADDATRALYLINGGTSELLQLGTGAENWSQTDSITLELQPATTYELVWQLQNISGIGASPGGFLAEINVSDQSSHYVLLSSGSWQVAFVEDQIDNIELDNLNWFSAVEYGANNASSTTWYQYNDDAPIENINDQAKWIWWETNWTDENAPWANDSVFIKTVITTKPERSPTMPWLTLLLLDENTPTVTISTPSDNSTHNIGDSISFLGSAKDTKDNILTDDLLVWTSSLDGQIGTGANFTTSDLSLGTHKVTLTATDSKGLEGKDSITIDIVDPIWGEAFYPLDETEGAIAYNSSFDSLNGAIVGATRSTGKINNALSFSLDLPSYVEFTLFDGAIDFPYNELSIEAWVNFESIDVQKTYHFFGDQRYGIKSSRIDVIDNQFRFTLYTNSTGSESIELIRSNYDFEVETWYHFAFTFDGDEARIYINGEINSTSQIIGSLYRVANTLYLGGVPESSGTASFPGYIDEFLFSRKLRSEEEIQAYYEMTQ